MTPEGKVKKRVTALLKEAGVYYYMPVPSGYGKPTVDYLGCAGGKFFAIETKAGGKLPTKFQQQVLDEIKKAGGAAFVVNDVDEYGYMTLRAFLVARAPNDLSVDDNDD